MRYERDTRGTGQLLRTREMRRMLTRRARAGMAWAVANAPHETGEYKTRFQVESFFTGGGTKGDRAYARLSNSDALAIEFGRTTSTGKVVEGHHVLARTVDVIEGGAS